LSSSLWITTLFYDKDVFRALANETKHDVLKRNIGVTKEIVGMIEGFLHFIESYSYENSQAYPLVDKANRHGIAHGAYTDAEYGKPINFYKTISAVDSLTFIASLRMQKKSGFAPEAPHESKALAARYPQPGPDGVAVRSATPFSLARVFFPC